MNINLQRKIDRFLGTFLCRLFSLLPRRRNPLSGGPKPSKILVILLSEMGSLVLARPMFHEIEKKYPRASIHVLLFKRNREFLEILNVIPKERIWGIDGESLMKMLKDSLLALIRMRKEKIDTVIDCELFSRVSSLFSFLSGAKIRVGFHPYNQEGLYRGNFINRPVAYNPYRHISQQFMALVEAIESMDVPRVKSQFKNDKPKVPAIKMTKDEMSRLGGRLKGDFPQMGDKKLVLLYPSGGLLPIRAWPLKHFCLVAHELIQQGHAVGIIGMEADKDLAKGIISYCNNRNCIDLTGYTKTVRELMILFHFASLLISNDGGPGHFASLTPVPTMVFYGPETPVLYGVLGDRAINFYIPLFCSPCLTAYNHRNSPCDGNNKCLKLIDPVLVIEKAFEILKDQESHVPSIKMISDKHQGVS